MRTRIKKGLFILFVVYMVWFLIKGMLCTHAPYQDLLNPFGKIHTCDLNRTII